VVQGGSAVATPKFMDRRTDVPSGRGKNLKNRKKEGRLREVLESYYLLRSAMGRSDAETKKRKTKKKGGERERKSGLNLYEERRKKGDKASESVPVRKGGTVKPQALKALNNVANHRGG